MDTRSAHVTLLTASWKLQDHQKQEEEYKTVRLAHKPAWGMRWLILLNPNPEVPSAGYHPWDFFGFISQSIKHTGKDKQDKHRPKKEPYYRRHRELRRSGSWYAGLRWHLETEDQAGLGPWWRHRGPRPTRTHVARVGLPGRTSGQRVRRPAGVNREWGLNGHGDISSGQLIKRRGLTECHLHASVFSLNLVFYWEGRSIFYFYFSICWIQTLAGRADPWACAPVEQRAKWERKIGNQRPQTRSHWCFVRPAAVPKNDCAQCQVLSDSLPPHGL